jgi:hypothetical protein
MHKRKILGVEIWVCEKAEANALDKQNKEESWRIWIQEEVDKYLLASPEELQAIIDKKRLRPGSYLK